MGMLAHTVCKNEGKVVPGLIISVITAQESLLCKSLQTSDIPHSYIRAFSEAYLVLNMRLAAVKFTPWLGVAGWIDPA